MKKFAKLSALVLALTLVLGVFAGCGGKGSGNDNSKKVSDVGAKVVDIPLSEEQYAFCLNKSDKELLEKANAYLAKIKEDGTFNAICDKYFADGTPAQFVSAVKDASKDQLIVATSTGFEPFEMVENDKFSGIDIEIAAGFAKYLGKELVIEDMKFESVVTSVGQGLCDIGMAGLTITPARQAVVSFSDSYYSANQMLIVPGDNTEFDNCKTAEDVAKILNEKTSATKIGCQNGTTGGVYIDGDADDPDGYGFPGLKATKMAFDYAALAVTAMKNGEIDYVIVDDAPAKAIVKAMNGGK